MKTLPIRCLFYELHERLLRRPTFSYLADLERTQWLSREEIGQPQMTKLKELLAWRCNTAHGMQSGFVLRGWM